MGDYATFRELCRYRTYYFPVNVDVDTDFDMRRVHPYKQSIVASMLLDLQSMPWITEAWLFGSALQPYCKPTSDIDIAYRMNKELVNKLCKEDRRFDWLETLDSRDPNGVDFVNLDNVKEFCALSHNIKKGVRLK